MQGRYSSERLELLRRKKTFNKLAAKCEIKHEEKMKDLIYLEGAEGMEKLASYAVARNLIPFFGAGFSAGAEALNGSVPDCTAAQEYMKKALIEENPECADYLAELDFTGIAGEFYNDVSELKRARYFEDNFTDVKLGGQLKSLPA